MPYLGVQLKFDFISTRLKLGFSFIFSNQGVLFSFFQSAASGMKEGTYNHLKLDNFPSLCNESGSKNKRRMTMESQYKENESPKNHQLINRSDGAPVVLSSPGSSSVNGRIPLSNHIIPSNGCPVYRPTTNRNWSADNITSTTTPLTHIANSVNGFGGVFHTPGSSSVTPGRRPLSNISNISNRSPVFFNTSGSSSAIQGRDSSIYSPTIKAQYSKSPLNQIRSDNIVDPPLSSNTVSFVVGDSHVPASSVTGSPSTIPSNKTWLKRSTPNVGQAESVVNFKNKKSRTLDKETLSQSTTCLFGPDEGRDVNSASPESVTEDCELIYDGDLFNDSDTDVEDTNIADEESIESDGVPTEEGKFLL
ncbi:hypothetical protein ACET3Z_016847 [Daucus carota]